MNDSETSGENRDALDALTVQVAGAMGRQHAADSRAFLNHLARFLVAALGEGAVIVRREGLFGGKNRPVKRLEVEFIEDGGAKVFRYSLEASGTRSHLAAQRVPIVRNVTLMAESLTVEEWIAAVSAAIAAESERNKASRDALEQLL